MANAQRKTKTHPFTEKIPEYLQPYIARQDPSLYTAIDHASWRFILKISRAFFTNNAHEKYLQGLKETGISLERIPLIQEMDQCLRKFNWQAVPVRGFIPPAVFMEFLSLGILPIACDMRTLEHLAYTPAPDIVHEAAGHAPIIADSDYADYLRNYGEISQKAIFSDQDMEVYHSIRELSDIKENPRSTAQEIEQVQQRLDRALAAVTYVSEATLLARMGWWTFEYGLVGDFNQPKIYGAGLLSSVGESYRCLKAEVKKIPFSIDCIQTSYDITRPQPQLFISPNFETLREALEELAEQMAFRKGGVEGLRRAKQAKTVTTTELETGVQVSGILVDFLTNSDGNPFYLKFKKPTQLSYKGQQIENQGPLYHREGFGTPLEKITEADLTHAGFRMGQNSKASKIKLSSGVEIQGKWVGCLKKGHDLILLSFENCTVTYGEEVLFQPDWGTYDIICGKEVVSVFGGAADRKSYLEATQEPLPQVGAQKSNLTPENQLLNELYAQLRKVRETGETLSPQMKESLQQIFDDLERNYPKDWLLRYELLELSHTTGAKLPFEKELLSSLKNLARQSPEIEMMVSRGLELLS